ncbi:MAG TPA: hypothetical protein VJ124_20255 [Pyrinomonadaceae bacterium]|nr:hypothetical protein [Pyrinomonadaceae bacterium]
MSTQILLPGHRSLLKSSFVALMLLAFCLSVPATTYAKKRKLANYGTIKIRTFPDGLPLEMDGKSVGETTSADREFEHLEPGIHSLVITLPDGRRWTRDVRVEAGRIKCLALNYRPAQVTESVCPFPVNISAPSQVNEGEIITYTADVSYKGTSDLNYTWTVTPASAKVLNGAGTATIAIDSTSLSGQYITATLVVDDGSGSRACRQTVQAATFVPRPPARVNAAREFDVCYTCSFDDQKARLDNLAVELQHDPSVITHIIAYGGRTSRIGQADRLLTRARDYLINKRGISPSRIVILNGGFREEDAVELWIVPSGATPPQPSPTVQAGDARPAPATPRKRQRG